MLLLAAVALLVAACASIGRPEGGPRDRVPPEFVHANPAPGATKVDRTKFDIFFNENVKLEDASNKIVVSPAQKQTPAISSNGRRVSVELRDTILPNTTYTIDFSDAIRDLNEGNILDGYAIDFSTGEEIDSLRISGMVFQARNLEPAQGMVVGVYSNLADSAISKLPMERVAKTNQYGQFTIRGLKPGTYNIFALDDKNHDWHWDRSENIAFFPVTVSPSAERVEVTDTLVAADLADSISVRQTTRFLPDDLLLTWFSEDYKPYYLRDYKRPERRILSFLFGAKPDSLPELNVISGPAAGKSLFDPRMAVYERRVEGDSLYFWLRDSSLIATDSLYIQAIYQKTDSLDRPVLQTDTLRMFFRDHKKKEKKKDKDKDKEDADSVPAPVFMSLSLKAQVQEYNEPLVFETSEPMDTFPLRHFRLELAVDSLWEDVELPRAARPDSLSKRLWSIPVLWEDGGKYRLTGDSLAIVNIYGNGIAPFKGDIQVRPIADYGSVKLNITDIPYDSLEPKAVIVELLDAQDKVVKAAPALPGQGALFEFLQPGTYFARAFIDANRNGKWDRGDLTTKTEPEEVYYYSKKINVRKNWDIAQDWVMFELPLEMQKPDQVKKNRPKTKERRPRNPDDENEEEEDEFGTGFGGNQFGNGSQYNNAHSRGNSRFSGGTRTNGMQTVRTQR